MRRAPHKLLPGVVLFLLFTWCCATLAQPTAGEAKVPYKVPVWQAGTTEAKFAKTLVWWAAASGTWASFSSLPRPRPEYIPLSFWAKRIRALDPIYVYCHGMNIVVVLKREGETEEGAYLLNGLSSFGIPSMDFAGFSLGKADETGLHRFVRRRPSAQKAGDEHP